MLNLEHTRKSETLRFETYTLMGYYLHLKKNEVLLQVLFHDQKSIVGYSRLWFLDYGFAGPVLFILVNIDARNVMSRGD